jgi:DNA-binding transcriptional ArsR family regulator
VTTPPSIRRPVSEPLAVLLAERLGVLAQPLRIRLVDRLDEHGEATVQQLADALGASQQNVSKHLAVLRGAGVVARRKEGTFARYRLTDPDALRLLEQAAAGVVRQLQRSSRRLG